MDQRIGLAAVDFAANPSDVNIDDVGRWIKMQIPDVLQEHRSRNHVADVANKIFEQLKLSRQQLDFPAAPTDDSGEQIHLQVADPQHRLLDHGRAATGERIDTGQHLRGGERFYQVVVSARAQAAHPVIDFAESAQDQRRGNDPLPPQAADDFDPVDARQHAVDGHDDIFDSSATAQSFLAISRKVDGVAARPQTIDQLCGRLRIVLNDKHAMRTAFHRRHPIRCVAISGYIIC